MQFNDIHTLNHKCLNTFGGQPMSVYVLKFALNCEKKRKKRLKRNAQETEYNKILTRVSS